MANIGYRIDWVGVQGVEARDFTCGHCGREVAAATGWSGGGRHLSASGEIASVDGGTVHRIRICPRCTKPTYFRDDEQMPGPTFGDEVDYLPADVERLYSEARQSMSAGSFNSAVMVARKLLMNVAVTKGAAVGENFKAYVRHLEQQGVVTSDMKEWVDEIRELGNDANHELPDMTADEAEAILTFVAMLLKLVYEYPERGRRSVAQRAAKQQPAGGPP